MKIKLTESGVGVFLMSLLVFLDMKPFFVWNSVSSVGYRIYTGLILVTTVFMAYRIFLKKRVVAGALPAINDRTNVSFSLFVSSITVVLLFFYKVYFSGVVTETQQPFNMAMLCIHLGLMFFSLQDNISLRQVFLVSKTIFAISLIPAILSFLLIQVGITPPMISLSAGEGVVGEWRTYDLYLGSSVMIRQGGVAFLNRLCGIYEEPGFVGTMGALFLFGDKLSFKKWQNVVIFIASLFTFSLAFILLFLLGLLLRLVGNLRKRSHFLLSATLIIALVVGYFVFMSIPMDESTMLGELQGRMLITDEGLAGDNRFGSSEWAVEAYDQFMRGDLRTRLFGYGQDSRVIPGTKINIWMGVHSYKEFVFGFGFLGLVFLVISFVLVYWAKFRGAPKGCRWQLFVLLALFLVSIYQRYMVTNFHYYCVLFGGAANLALMDRVPAKDKPPHEEHRD